MNEPQLSAAKPADPRGLTCPKCSCQHFDVVYTRRGWGGKIIRRRECRYCGRRITTWDCLSSQSVIGR